ncbi:hypothetical protein IB268_11985 [Achromobacter sp. ACM01]|uniref:hypothetical protein n=1 Tax=Achromobacter sp. ACM01 TaxID=2769298 RepID=UPI00177AB7A3|nr:hypothetical protein [Achromobacter sp. ACM01]MBD9473629.1 hypothetical protein [Achromobacter sp. ACM01]
MRQLVSWSLLVAPATMAAVLSFSVGAQSMPPPQAEASNWCEEARKALTDANGNAVECAAVAKRCIKMNNYWCQKHGASSWRGTTDAQGNDGNRDVDGHAIFDAAAWSARAIAMDLRSKYRRGLVSAVDIAAAHSPWCDTLGSKAVVNGHGRTCKDGRAKPAATFAGPWCEAPKKAAPGTADCAAGCNCPPEIASVLVRDLNLDINADLKLFDAAGMPLPNLTIVLRNLALQEQGVRVRTSVIEQGIGQLGK